MLTAVSEIRPRALEYQPTQTKGMFLKLVVIVTVLIASALFYVWCRVQVLNQGYVLSKSKSKEVELSKINEKLKLEELHLMNPSRIEKIAREELGLILPAPNRIKYVGEEIK